MCSVLSLGVNPKGSSTRIAGYPQTLLGVLPPLVVKAGFEMGFIHRSPGSTEREGARKGHMHRPILPTITMRFSGAAKRRWPPHVCEAAIMQNINSPRQVCLLTCVNSSSTGVSRPKIDTVTLRRWFSSSTSSTVPSKSSKGPSLTLTRSPTS